MDDQTIRLILDLGKSGANVEEVRRALEGLRTTSTSTAEVYEVLGRQVGEYEATERRAVETAKVEATMLQQLNVELEKQAGLYHVAATETAGLSKAATAAIGSKGPGGLGVLGVSYAVQDFTSVLSGGQGLGRALSSIQNNIPVILVGMGVGAGLTGVVSVLSVGVGLLIDNWDKLARLWGAGHTEEETKHMKDLADATKHAADEAERLLKTKPPEQRQAGADVRRAVDAFGAEAVIKELAEALKTRGDFGPDANRRMAQTLVANLLQGNRGAVQLLGELPLHGPVGQVLSGGMTPAEQRAFRRRQEAEATQRQKAADEARGKQEQDQDDMRRAMDRQIDNFNRALQKAQREATPEERKAIDKAAESERKRVQDFMHAKPLMTREQQQVMAIQTQLRAMQRGEATPGEQAKLNFMQRAMGQDFPNLFNQTFENQNHLNQILRDLARKGSRTAQQLLQTQQSNQMPANMGIPF